MREREREKREREREKREREREREGGGVCFEFGKKNNKSAAQEPHKMDSHSSVFNGCNI